MTLKPKGNATTITKNITVVSNDPEQPNFTLTMTGKLLVDIGAKPGVASINNLKPGEAGSATFALMIAPESTAKILSVELVDSEHFELRRLDQEPEAESGSGGDPTYEVTFEGADEVGVVSTEIIVKTDGEHTPELRVPVRASTTYNLQYISRVRFSYRNGVLSSRVVRITGRHTGKAPKIKKVVDPDGILDYEVLEARGAMANIRLEVKPDALAKLDDEARTGSHELTVHTDDKDEPTIVFEYRVAPEPTASAQDSAAPGTIEAVNIGVGGAD